jgi:glycosyltransferase involved in cell wall biosynthesis
VSGAGRALVGAYHPPEDDRDSGSRRVLDMIRWLRAAGWTVGFLASRRLGEERYVRQLQQMGVPVFEGAKVRVDRLLSCGRFDLALFAFWPVAETYVPVVRRVSPGTRVVVDSVDLHFVRNARRVFQAGVGNGGGGLDSSYGGELVRELNVYAAADAVLTVSRQEADMLSRLLGGGRCVEVVPDVESASGSPPGLGERRGVVFAGSFGHEPNVGAMEHFCGEVLPRLDRELLERHPVQVLGSGLDERVRRCGEGWESVRMVGWVPDLRPYFERARVSVVPLRYGAGTKRKLLQSLMAGTPVVTTSVGAEGFDVRDGEEVLIADEPGRFAGALDRLLRDDELWGRLAAAGRAHLMATHGPEAARARWDAVLERVMRGPVRCLGGLNGEGGSDEGRVDLREYGELCEAVRRRVEAVVPEGSRVLVVSRGDEELVKFEGREGWHFPQTAEGVYAGYHPADSASAITHLEALRARGGQFLLVPRTALWWLRHYVELREHLERRHVRLVEDGSCALYQLSGVGMGAGGRGVRAGRSQGRVGRGSAAGRYDVICLPIIEWGFRFQRPQQLMGRFAAAGHRVFYVSTAFRSAGRCWWLRREGAGVRGVGLRGRPWNVYHDAMDEGGCEGLLESLVEVLRGEGVERAVLMVELPFWWPLAERVRDRYGWPVVYDCMDHHGGFATNGMGMLAQEGALLKGADLVVASSGVLEAEARKRADRVMLVRNGCDYGHFARRRRRRGGGDRRVVGYYGAIAEWFDASLVADLAERRPDWDFVLVGSTFGGEVERLSRLANVLLAGERPYREIPRWLAGFDVAMLPFKRVPLTEAANPVKAYEILAAGKPLVSVPLPEVRLLGSLVRLAETVEEWEGAIELELTNPDPAMEGRRRAFAEENTWQQRYETLAPVMDGLLTRREDCEARGAV